MYFHAWWQWQLFLCWLMLCPFVIPYKPQTERITPQLCLCKGLDRSGKKICEMWPLKLFIIHVYIQNLSSWDWQNRETHSLVLKNSPLTILYIVRWLSSFTRLEPLLRTMCSSTIARPSPLPHRSSNTLVTLFCAWVHICTQFETVICLQMHQEDERRKSKCLWSLWMFLLSLRSKQGHQPSYFHIH